jgi:hypothetical protein
MAGSAVSWFISKVSNFVFDFERLCPLKMLICTVYFERVLLYCTSEKTVLHRWAVN